jgi:2'-hydroxyisoflavone reductase
MDILVLGGTRFVGRHTVDAALMRGHRVTLFNRGSDRDVLPALERRIGDRDGGLAALDDGVWDAVIDVSGHLPRLVADSARRLAARVGRYAFVSTVSVYADPTGPTTDEDAEKVELADPTTETIDPSTYGGLKVACEREVERAYGERALIVRPGVVVGPFDRSDRFTYWVRRVAAGGEVLGPQGPDAPTQWIDGRDLGEWTIAALERELAGPYNVVIPPGSVGFGMLLASVAAVTGSAADVTWVDGGFLLEQGLRPFVDLPLWLPDGDDGLLRIDPSRALADGLRLTSLATTVRDTHAWDVGRGAGQLAAGLPRERERGVLAAWHARTA